MGRESQTQAQAMRDWPAVRADLVRSMGFTLYENPRKYIGWLEYGETRIRVGFDKQACQWIVDLETEVLGRKVSPTSAERRWPMCFRAGRPAWAGARPA